MLVVLNAYHAKNMLLYIADKIIEQKPFLTEVDSAIGDGDHGIGMAGGMVKVKQKLDKEEYYSNVYEIFEIAGKAMLMSMGGASGVLFGSLFLGGSRGKRPKEEITSMELAAIMRGGLDAVKERGKAEIGDKTMVDSLEPAVIAMEEKSGAGMLPMLLAAEEACAQGVENSKQFVAKFGRAKSMMERAIGFQDAGATSVLLIIQGMREYAQTHN